MSNIKIERRTPYVGKESKAFYTYIPFVKNVIRILEDYENYSIKDIKELTGADVVSFQTDLNSSKDIDSMIKKVMEQYGRVDILVNNTGGPKAGFFDDLTDEDWISTFENTFLSVVRMTRAVLPSMKRNKWGRIVNISSVSAKQPIDNLILSNGIRMSVHGWAKTLSNELASDNILINNVCPGFTKTERVDDLVANQAKDMDMAEERLGERIKDSYLWKTLIDNNILLIGGSDFPVEDSSPLMGIYAAVNRTKFNNIPYGGWQPKELLNLKEALEMYTKNTAYGSFKENLKGNIEIGHIADFTFIDRDISSLPNSEILKCKISATMVNGEMVYKDF